MFAIEVNDIWKKYRVDYKRRISLKESLLNLGRKKTDFWALQGISFQVEKGEIIGIIGSNGSGKTTLLRIILGITKPTRGKIKVNGRMVGLLELGAGFHQDLTGRENIYLNGSVLGLKRKEIARCIDSIIDFADIGDFINAPVRTYSAGMYLRLGFAIAAHTSTDILLIDEVLAVGDAEFQAKCLKKINGLKNEGKTIIFVSHNLDAIKNMCDKALLLDKGEIVDKGSPDEIVSRYLVSCYNRGISGSEKFSREISITNVYFKNSRGESAERFNTGEEMRIIIEFIAHQRVVNPVFDIGIYAKDAYLLGPNTRDDNYPIDFVEGEGAIEFVIKSIPFVSGEYEVSVSVHNSEESQHYDLRYRSFKFRVLSGKKRYGAVVLDDASWMKVK